MAGPYCRTCGGGCPSTGCLKAPFIWGFDGCFLRARLNGIDIKPLDLCKWLYCHETDTKMQLVPNGEDSYIEYYSERDINGCDNGVDSETDKIYICDLLGLGNLNCLSDVLIEDPQQCQLMVYSPGGVGDDCPGCDEHKKDKWTNYTIPEAAINMQTDDVVSVNEHGCLVKGKITVDECLTRGSTVEAYTKNPYSGLWYTPGGALPGSAHQYGPIMGTPSYTNDTECDLLVRLDAYEYMCSTATDSGPYNFTIGLSIVSSRPDIGGETERVTWDHLVSDAGTNHGVFQRLTVSANNHQIVRLAPGQTVNWTVRSFRLNFGTTTIVNDDGTSAGDTSTDKWTIQTWRAE